MTSKYRRNQTFDCKFAAIIHSFRETEAESLIPALQPQYVASSLNCKTCQCDKSRSHKKHENAHVSELLIPVPKVTTTHGISMRKS